jgi:hypothetical protein
MRDHRRFTTLWASIACCRNNLTFAYLNLTIYQFRVNADVNLLNRSLNGIIILRKAIPVTGRGGLYRCEMLRTTHCLDGRLIDGGELVSLTHRPCSAPQKHYFSAHFC